jgi:hypothetical protein
MRQRPRREVCTDWDGVTAILPCCMDATLLSTIVRLQSFARRVSLALYFARSSSQCQKRSMIDNFCSFRILNVSECLIENPTTMHARDLHVQRCQPQTHKHQHACFENKMTGLVVIWSILLISFYIKTDIVAGRDVGCIHVCSARTFSQHLALCPL